MSLPGSFRVFSGSFSVSGLFSGLGKNGLEKLFRLLLAKIVPSLPFQVAVAQWLLFGISVVSYLPPCARLLLQVESVSIQVVPDLLLP